MVTQTPGGISRPGSGASNFTLRTVHAGLHHQPSTLVMAGALGNEKLILLRISVVWRLTPVCTLHKETNMPLYTHVQSAQLGTKHSIQRTGGSQTWLTIKIPYGA